MSESTNPQRVLFNSALLLSCASTLLCCALPALLVTVGAGSTVALMAATLPGAFEWVGVAKPYLFGLAAGLLLLGGWGLRRECSQEKAWCSRVTRANRWLYFSSLLAFVVGAIAALR